jgi:hypothetical protein
MLGLHINKLTPATRRQVLAYSWRILKFMDCFDADLFSAIKSKYPATILVGRHYYADQSLSPQDAVNVITSQSPDILHLIDYWEVYNEILTKDNIEDVASRNLVCAQLLHAAGLKFCALSLGVGTPAGTDAEITHALDVLWPSVSASDAWSYHLYGAPGVLSDAEWAALRYRKYVSLDPRYGKKLLIGSEGGQDYGVIKQSGGWLKHNITPQEYAQQLLDLQVELAKDSYMAGVTIFQAGDDTDPQAWTDGSQTWGSFAAGETVTNIIGPHVLQPSPPPPPDPHLDYFGQLGFRPNPETALYQQGLLPLRLHALELQAQGKTNLSQMTMPGPCMGEEYTVVEQGQEKIRRKLTNRILEAQVHAGQWIMYQAELFS